jgi:glycosyltransferase involved in cell wall biosynthesis
MPPQIYVDARIFQDPDRRSGEAASHVASLLTSRNRSEARNWRAAGLSDDRMEAVPVGYADLFDELTTVANPILPASGSVFIHTAPMTYETRLTSRFARHPNLLTAAIVDDSDLMDGHSQPVAVVSRMAHLSKLARLRKCDMFMLLSHQSALRLQQMLGIRETRITVTGAAVRSSLVQSARRGAGTSAAVSPKERFFLMVGGEDGSGSEVVMQAVHRVRLLSGQPLRLKIAGRYSEQGRADLCRAAGELGDANFMEVVETVDDDMLAGLYAETVATIIPSRIQGFSVPVVEAATCHSPVIAPTCPAHLELIQQPEALFTPADDEELAEKLSALLNDPNLRTALLKSQAHLAEEFTETCVGARFWDSIVKQTHERFSRPAASISRHVKPRLAILSPFPPDPSGCARFTERTIEAGQKAFDIDLFTNAPRPLASSKTFRDAGPINIGVFGSQPYEGVLSVIGNSPYHDAVFDFVDRFGGPCILHDSRLTQVYHCRLGREGFIRFASTLLERAVTDCEVEAWLQDRDVPSYFVEPIIKRAAPLIVHTRAYQRLLKQRYDFDAQLATFPPSHLFSEADLSREAREAARRRNDLEPGSFVLSAFGYVHRSKGVVESIQALQILRSWNIPAELHFVGALAEPEEELLAIVREVGVEGHVHFAKRFVEDATYRDFLIASDAAIALRTYGFGQPSAALSDCIAAGLPSVATVELAEACESPSYVRTIGEGLSPMQIAEQLAAIREEARLREWWLVERADYLRMHSFEYYVQRLREILGV